MGRVDRSELVDPDPEAGEEAREGIVLATRQLQVDRMAEAVGGLVEGCAECGARPLDENVAERRRHGLRPEGSQR